MGSDFEFIAAQSAEALQRTASAMGAPAGEKNLTGPNGERVSAVWRPASPLETMDADKEMTLHGWKDRELWVAAVTAAQFANNPTLALAWREKSVIQTSPVVRSGIVSQVRVDDAHWYTFIIVSRQPSRNG